MSLTGELTGLRERKKAQTRQALAEAALELFTARGYDATTVEDIAAAADISPRTFFRYFATKDEVLFGDSDTARAAFREILHSRPADEPLFAALRATAVALLDSEAVDPDGASAVMRLVNGHPALQARYLELLRVIEDDVAEWAAARLGEAATDLRPRLVAAAAMSARRVAFDAWLEAGATGPFTPYMLDAMEILTTGLHDL